MTDLSTSHYSTQQLEKYLKQKNLQPLEHSIPIKAHLEVCTSCWNTWNKVRWDAAMMTECGRELAEYMGDSFVPYLDSSWEIARKWNEINPKTREEISNFYRTNTDYIYNLTIWGSSGDRENYLPDILWLKNKYQLQSVVDFGCGTGNDSIPMAMSGLTVYSVDFDCPSVEFLKWRVAKRNIQNQVLIFDVDLLTKLPAADLFWSIDVLEHLPDPLAIIDILDESTRVFAHRSPFSDTHQGRHPCHLPFDDSKLNNLLKAKGFSLIPMPHLSVWVKKD